MIIDSISMDEFIDFMAAATPTAPEVENLPPAVRDPLDPASVQDLFVAFQKEIDRLADMATAHEVTDDASHRQAVEMIGQLKGIYSKIDNKRKDSKEPYLRMGQAIDGFCRPLTAAIVGATADLELKVRPYMLELDRKRREEQSKRDAEAKRLNDEAAAQAKAEAQARVIQGEPEPPPSAIPRYVSQQLPSVTQTKTNAGSAKLKTEWVGTLTDIRSLPDKCLQARFAEIEKAVRPWINAQIKAGSRSISGVKVEEVAKVDVRAKR